MEIIIREGEQPNDYSGATFTPGPQRGPWPEAWDLEGYQKHMHNMY